MILSILKYPSSSEHIQHVDHIHSIGVHLLPSMPCEGNEASTFGKNTLEQLLRLHFFESGGQVHGFEIVEWQTTPHLIDIISINKFRQHANIIY